MGEEGQKNKGTHRHSSPSPSDPELEGPPESSQDYFTCLLGFAVHSPGCQEKTIGQDAPPQTGTYKFPFVRYMWGVV